LVLFFGPFFGPLLILHNFCLKLSHTTCLQLRCTV
jgi:hypothetical protein